MSIKEEKTSEFFCDQCEDTGEVSCMEAVYPGEPHMANVGTRPCPSCNPSFDDEDDYDDQE